MQNGERVRLIRLTGGLLLWLAIGWKLKRRSRLA
jgi:hypothetical protein